MVTLDSLRHLLAALQQQLYERRVVFTRVLLDENGHEVGRITRVYRAPDTKERQATD